MLNCGFTNIDVATLLKTEVNLSEGRIIRQRTKTRRHSHPPIVNYKLWPKRYTFKRHKSSHPTLALTNRAGNRLSVSELIEKDGKRSERIWTSLARRFGEMKKTKPKMPRKALMFLRKTGSTKIRSNTTFLSLDSLYLVIRGQPWLINTTTHSMVSRISHWTRPSNGSVKFKILTCPRVSEAAAFTKRIPDHRLRVGDSANLASSGQTIKRVSRSADSSNESKTFVARSLRSDKVSGEAVAGRSS